MGSRTQERFAGGGKNDLRQGWAAKKRKLSPLIENAPFCTLSEVELYLSGDYVVCLECNKSCKSLPQHLAFTHALSSTEYKAKYNIPKTRSLRGVSTREKAAEKMRDRWNADPNKDTRKEYMRCWAKEKLVPTGTKAARTFDYPRKSKDGVRLHIYPLLCANCKKEFMGDEPDRKFCSQSCSNHVRAVEYWKRIGSKGGRTRAVTGKRTAQGKFSVI